MNAAFLIENDKGIYKIDSLAINDRSCREIELYIYSSSGMFLKQERGNLKEFDR